METSIRLKTRNGRAPIARDNRLREIRRAQDKTQAECASAAGVTPQAIAKAEQKTSSLGISKWIKIAVYLNTPLHDLVCL